MQALADIVIASPLPSPVCRDPDDDAILACALAGHVHWIVSGDNDLLTFTEFQHILIITPTEAIDRLAALKSI